MHSNEHLILWIKSTTKSTKMCTVLNGRCNLSQSWICRVVKRIRNDFVMKYHHTKCFDKRLMKHILWIRYFLNWYLVLFNFRCLSFIFLGIILLILQFFFTLIWTTTILVFSLYGTSMYIIFIYLFIVVSLIKEINIFKKTTCN